MSLNDAVRRFDLVRYCEDRGARIVASDEYLLTCPQCGKEKLTVNIKRFAWHCWTCEGQGAVGRGNLLQLIRLLDKVSTSQAAETIILGARRVHIPIDHIDDADLVEHIELDFKPAPAISPPIPWQSISVSLPYMERRGITLEDARLFGLYVCTAGRYADRLIFPVWEEGRHVYWQARAMWDAHEHVPRWEHDKYIKSLNPPREDVTVVSSEVLMNLDQARHYERVAIVEGPIDCVKAGPSAVCTFGKKMSSQQIAKLLRAGVKAVDLMWDGPSHREPQGAWREMIALAPTLAMFFDVNLVRLPDGDPGQRTRQELDQLRAQAEPFDAFSALAYI